MNKKLTIALAGNPNSGKTTVFNALTGGRQHVGNYPGVTVEKKEGTLRYRDYEITVVDLPGTYSLTAYSIDEIVARNFLVEEKPDVMIDIVDSSNLERNLYLATQLMELEIPLIIDLNMFDLAKKQGLKIDTKRLSELLGTPLSPTVASKKEGIDELLETAIAVAEGRSKLRKTTVGYGREIQEEISKLEEILNRVSDLDRKYPDRWLAVKVLEEDGEVLKKIGTSSLADEIFRQVRKSREHLRSIFGDTPEAIIADRRYGFISGACSEAVKKTYEIRHTISDRIDKVLVNRILGLPIFLGMMWVMFKFIFKVSEPLMGWVEAGQEWLGNLFGSLLPDGGAVQSLIVDGIIGGVGSVLVFVPIIFLLFLAIAILEDSGYMARAAFIMDRIMHKIGLHGRSFIPMLLGFGCNMPAIMATRTIEDRKDRFVTILVNPFISCGARLPVYTLLIGAFFADRVAGNVLFSIYLLGIAVAIIMAKIFRKYLFKGPAAPFVMELPPYRLPTLKGIFIHMWERGAVYLKKAGTIIFAGCVLIWFLSNFPWSPKYSQDYEGQMAGAEKQFTQKTGLEPGIFEEEGSLAGLWEEYRGIEEEYGDDETGMARALADFRKSNHEEYPSVEAFTELQEQISDIENKMAFEKMEKSYAGKLGRTIAPVFKPLGFGDWRVSVGLIGGFIAKEIVVGTLGTLYAVGEADEESESLRQALQNDTRPDGSKLFTPLVAYSLMVFVLLYVPCVACIAVIKRETNSWKWPIFAAIYITAIAWLVSFIVYQGGRLLGLG